MSEIGPAQSGGRRGVNPCEYWGMGHEAIKQALTDTIKDTTKTNARAGSSKPSGSRSIPDEVLKRQNPSVTRARAIEDCLNNCALCHGEMSGWMDGVSTTNCPTARAVFAYALQGEIYFDKFKPRT